jgi:hypothetical protein
MEPRLSARFDPRTHEYEERSRSAGMIYVLLIVVACAFGGFVWQLYSAPEIPRISAPSGPYKIQPGENANALDVTEQSAFASAGTEAATPRPGPEEVAEAPSVPMAALSGAPRFVSNGPYVAQLAALQSESGIDPAWRRLASRAPDLFANARLDVERADLGARGVYHRVRAGYFADRENAAQFCERIRRMGQDCIVVAR